MTNPTLNLAAITTPSPCLRLTPEQALRIFRANPKHAHHFLDAWQIGFLIASDDTLPIPVCFYGLSMMGLDLSYAVLDVVMLAWHTATHAAPGTNGGRPRKLALDPAVDFGWPYVQRFLRWQISVLREEIKEKPYPLSWDRLGGWSNASSDDPAALSGVVNLNEDPSSTGSDFDPEDDVLTEAEQSVHNYESSAERDYATALTSEMSVSMSRNGVYESDRPYFLFDAPDHRVFYRSDARSAKKRHSPSRLVPPTNSGTGKPITMTERILTQQEEAANYPIPCYPNREPYMPSISPYLADPLGKPATTSELVAPEEKVNVLAQQLADSLVASDADFYEALNRLVES